MHLYGLIGNSLAHSFSKKYFTEKFERENITDCVFELYSLQAITEFPKLIENKKRLNGLAVTIPYKESVIPYLDSLHDSAKKTGAVNCIKFSNNILTGYNTDILGFEKSFIPLLQTHHKNALVLGSGGASKAVQYILEKTGISYLIVSRKPGSKLPFISYEQIDKKLIERYPVIINCTPIGMFPNVHEQPEIPYQYLSSNNLLFDMVYSPPETSFLKKAAEKGAIVKNGYEMLTIQAEENWRIWNEL